MTEAPTWRAHVVAMIAQAQAHQEEFFYRTTLPEWEKELRAIERDETIREDENDH